MPKERRGSKSRVKRLLRWLAEGVILLLILYLAHLWQIQDAVEGSAPALSAQTLTGDAFSLAQSGEKPLLVYFWATWCPVCNLSADNIDELAENHSVITIAMQSGDGASIAAHLREKGLSFPVIADPQGRIASDWHVRGVPTLYFLDASRNIRSVTVGYTSLLGMKARLWLAQ